MFCTLQTMFSPFDITAAVELTLGGDMVLTDLHRLQWNYAHKDQPTPAQNNGTLCAHV
jgi:hypothetical protein